MRSLIRDSVVLPAPAEVLYGMYLDPAKHAAITGAPVTIGAEAGSLFSAFGGSLTGAMLAAIPCTLVVQLPLAQTQPAMVESSDFVAIIRPA